MGKLDHALAKLYFDHELVILFFSFLPLKLDHFPNIRIDGVALALVLIMYIFYTLGSMVVTDVSADENQQLSSVVYSGQSPLFL